MAINVWIFDGPAAALVVSDDVKRFTAQRGLAEMGANSRASALERLVDVGRFGEVLTRYVDLVELEEAGVMGEPAAVELYAAVARTHRELGDAGAAASGATHALEKARQLDHWLGLVVAGAPAASAALDAGDRRSALALLAEVADRPDEPINEEFAGRLPALVRCALAAGDVSLAERLAEGVGDAGLPLHEHAFVAAQAQIVEAQGGLREAAELFEDAAARWDGFGAKLEQAYALQGQGRCLVALDDRAAEPVLRDARALFAEMGARARVEECDALLTRALAEGA